MTTHKHHSKTKAGKAAKVSRVMGEYKAGVLRSSSGGKVVKRKQAVTTRYVFLGKGEPLPFELDDD